MCLVGVDLTFLENTEGDASGTVQCRGPEAKEECVVLSQREKVSGKGGQFELVNASFLSPHTWEIAKSL